MKRKVLVVDDQATQRDLYADLFKSKGYEVVSAGDGSDGLHKALRDKPDVIFTGIMMPGMDGFELIKNLRANVSTVKLPVIMFSHLNKAEDRERASKIADVYFMVKGVDKPVDILKKVEELMPKDKTTP